MWRSHVILIDTNALLWLSGGSERLGVGARARIQGARDRGEAIFSAVSIWEVALLAAKGRYTLGQPVLSWRADLVSSGLREIAVGGEAAALSVALENLYPDPADRFLAAQSLCLPATLLTSDRKLLDWATRTPGAAALDARA